jgi:hypothetical protein
LTGETVLKPIENYHELYIFKNPTGKALVKVIELFCALLEEFFPGCMESSPVRLSLSISGTKYPFQRHWEWLRSPGWVINIQKPKVFNLGIGVKKFYQLKEQAGEASRFLHGLVELYERLRSVELVTVRVLEERKRYPEVFNLHVRDGCTVEEILNFYKFFSIG